MGEHVQLVILLVGFPDRVAGGAGQAGGLRRGDSSPAVPPWFGDFFYSPGPLSGWTFLFLTFPAFIISPGLIQKSFGARASGR